MARVKHATAANIKRLRNRMRTQNAITHRRLPTHTQSVRQSLQCKSDTIKKKRCKKRTAHTSQCWIHLAKEKNLRVKPSTVNNAGKGLFTYKQAIQRGEKIDAFTGEKTNQAKLDRKYGVYSTAEYALCRGPNNCIDSYLTTHGAPRFANDARGSKYKNNSRISFSKNKNFNLKSTKRIKPHQEILTNYGDSYWPRNLKKNK